MKRSLAFVSILGFLFAPGATQAEPASAANKKPSRASIARAPT